MFYNYWSLSTSIYIVHLSWRSLLDPGLKLGAREVISSYYITVIFIWTTPFEQTIAKGGIDNSLLAGVRQGSPTWRTTVKKTANWRISYALETSIQVAGWSYQKFSISWAKFDISPTCRPTPTLFLFSERHVKIGDTNVQHVGAYNY